MTEKFGWVPWRPMLQLGLENVENLDNFGILEVANGIATIQFFTKYTYGKIICIETPL